MTSRKTPPKRTGTSGRPQKIIDLEAKEVPDQEANTDPKPASSTAASRAKTTAKTSGSASSSPASSSDKAGGKPSPAPEQTGRADKAEHSHMMRHLPLLLAAIAGGIIALAGNGIIGNLSGSADQHGENIAALTGQLETSSSAIRGEIAQIKQDTEDRLSGLDGVTKQLSQQFDTAKKDLSDLSGKLTEAGSGNGAVSEISEGVKALAARVENTENLLQGLEKSTEGSSGANSVQIEGFRGELENQGKEIQSINDQLAKLTAKTDQIEANAQKLADAAQEVRDIRDTQLDEEQTRLRKNTADALQAAHMDGQDVSPFLTPARSMVSSTDAIDELQKLAENGIATNQDLISGFRVKLRSILGAAGKESDGLVGKFLSNAMTLVTVKPAGPVDGDNPAAIASRIDAALGAGQFGDALKEWETLPQPSRDVSADWQMKLKSRIEADKLLDQIVAELKSGTPDSG